MENVNSLLLGSVSLVIILSIWVLSWIIIGKVGQTKNNLLISIRLFWLYIAIAFAMVAITLSLIKVHFEGLSAIEIYVSGIIFKEFIYNLAFSFAISAFIMGFISIIESIMLIAISGWKNGVLYNLTTNDIKVRRIWFIILVGFAIFVFILSTLTVIFSEWFIIGLIVLVILYLYLSIAKVSR